MNVNVILNNQNILCSLKNYVNYYTNDSFDDKEIIIERYDRWEVGVVLSKNHKYLQVSLVNGITTTRGGKHVDNIINQLVKKLNEVAQKKKRKLM